MYISIKKMYATLYMRHSEFMSELHKMKLTRKEFAELAEIPLPTVIGWGATRKNKTVKKVPDWVQPFLNLQKEVTELRITLNRVLTSLPTK
ncbi:hypothetical protein [Maridesulfovibrio sp. FT414]|uniref:hypothetical protein n=1 Tax=Maridesulfovibrio sp. FT414 TaxID=2979469 RepID=UPI003D8025EB